MKIVSGIRYVVVGAFLAACGASGVALADNEVEPNFPMSSAQPLNFDGSGTATVDAFLGGADADIYSFWAKEGDVITVDIDGGVKAGAGSVDTFVSVHGTASNNYIVLRGNDDAAALDAGSIGPEDSYIANLVIPADGVYYISVVGYPNRVLDGGVFTGGGPSGAPINNAPGSYTLIVSGVSPLPPAPAPATDPDPAPASDPAPAPASDPDPAPSPSSDSAPAPDQIPPQTDFPASSSDVRQVRIDIKPGQRGIAKINPKSRHRIPVALLSSRHFNALAIDRSSLTFGRTGDEQSLVRCFGRGVHVNRDRRRDLVCEFENQLAEFEVTDEEGVLRGKMLDGTPFEGRGMLKVIAEKRRHHRSDERHARDDDRGRNRHR
jgi:hypothetical protein